MTTFADDEDWDDPSFLSQLEAAEAEGVRWLSQQEDGVNPSYNKRKRQNAPGTGEFSPQQDFGREHGQDKASTSQPAEEEGDYTAALKGSKSAKWESKVPAPRGTGYEGGPNRAAESYGGSGSGQQSGAVPERSCPCGAGMCSVLTARTEKNMGRRFYRCPKGKDEGCSFFEWCDSGGSQLQGYPRDGQTQSAGRGDSGWSADRISQPQMDCPCGAGPCAVLTAKTEKNNGRMFYRCPKAQTCGFFKWCDDDSSKASGGSYGRDNSNSSGRQGVAYQSPMGAGNPAFGSPGGYLSAGAALQSPPAGHAGFNSPGGGGGNTGNCFTCGQSGHWSKDCQQQRGTSSSGRQGSYQSAGAAGHAGFGSPGGGGGNTGNCFTCGQTGHWSKDCPQQRNTSTSGVQESGPRFGSQQDNAGKTSGACYKCGQPGHWAPNCPVRVSPQKPWVSPGSRKTTTSTGAQNSGGMSSSGGRGGPCFKCGQPGHWAPDCRSNTPQAKSQKVSVSPNSKNKCYKCGKPGHWAPNCPSKGSPLKNNSGYGRGRGR